MVAPELDAEVGDAHVGTRSPRCDRPRRRARRWTPSWVSRRATSRSELAFDGAGLQGMRGRGCGRSRPVRRGHRARERTRFRLPPKWMNVMRGSSPTKCGVEGRCVEPALASAETTACELVRRDRHYADQHGAARVRPKRDPPASPIRWRDRERRRVATLRSPRGFVMRKDAVGHDRAGEARRLLDRARVECRAVPRGDGGRSRRCRRDRARRERRDRRRCDCRLREPACLCSRALLPPVPAWPARPREAPPLATPHRPSTSS
jgi:hypothetical protein